MHSVLFLDNMLMGSEDISVFVSQLKLQSNDIPTAFNGHG